MRDRHRRAVATHGSEATQIANTLRSLHSRSGHNLRTLWTDWVSAMALAIANAGDRRPAVWRAREDEYMQIVGRHGAEAMDAFASMLAVVRGALEAEPFDLRLAASTWRSRWATITSDSSSRLRACAS